MTTFGEVLRELRKERDLTQVELAPKIHLSQATVAKIEGDQQAPQMETVRRLIKVLAPKNVRQFVTLAAFASVPEDLRKHL